MASSSQRDGGPVFSLAPAINYLWGLYHVSLRPIYYSASRGDTGRHQSVSMSIREPTSRGLKIQQ